MFGSLGFMVTGNLTICIRSDDVMYKVGPEAAAVAIEAGNALPMEMRGRPLRGWVLVGYDTLEDKAEFDGWLQLAMDWTNSHPRQPSDNEK